jgi:hypothetical protein
MEAGLIERIAKRDPDFVLDVGTNEILGRQFDKLAAGWEKPFCRLRDLTLHHAVLP